MTGPDVVVLLAGLALAAILLMFTVRVGRRQRTSPQTRHEPVPGHWVPVDVDRYLDEEGGR